MFLKSMVVVGGVEKWNLSLCHRSKFLFIVPLILIFFFFFLHVIDCFVVRLMIHLRCFRSFQILLFRLGASGVLPRLKILSCGEKSRSLNGLFQLVPSMALILFDDLTCG